MTIANRAALLVLAAAALPATAGTLIAELRIDPMADAEVGCALFDGPDGFPTANAEQPQQWAAADRPLIVCTFADLPAGDYAVAASRDENGNRKTDTNFVGMPKEDWAVSNNVRPTFRAPTFAEATVAVPATGDVVIQMELR